MPKQPQKLRRYSVAFPDKLFSDLEEAAQARGMTIVELLKRFITLGLMVLRISETEGSSLIIREGDKEREIVLL